MDAGSTINPLLGDTHAWLQDVFQKSIDDAGILFFSQLGYVDSRIKPELPRCRARRFIYSMLPQDRILNNLDRFYMDTIKEASFLFEMRDKSERLPFFAIDLKSAGSSRSDDAYGVHYIIAKCCECNNIALFRHEDALLLSFQMVTKESGIQMFFSDWTKCQDCDDGRLEDWCVASTSTKDLESQFEDFAYNAMRSYQRHPLTPQTARYATFGTNDLFHPLYPFFYSRSEVWKATQELLDEIPREYGDDYIVSKMESIEEEDLYDIDDIEWEMEHAEDDKIASNGDEGGDGVYTDTLDSSMPNDIPEDAFANPILLLEWMDKRDEEDMVKSEKNAGPTLKKSKGSGKDDKGKPAKDAGTNPKKPKGPDKKDKGRSKKNAGVKKIKKKADKNITDGQQATAIIIDWKSALNGRPPIKGSFVLHSKYGYGKVLRATSTRFFADFNGIRHWLVFPTCFENETVALVEGISKK